MERRCMSDDDCPGQSTCNAETNLCERPNGNNGNEGNPGNELPDGVGDACEGPMDCPDGLLCNARVNRCVPDCRIEGNVCPQNGVCDPETGFCMRNGR